MTDDRNAMNQQVIDEFRTNGGIVGGFFEGKTLLLLHHTGAKSNKPYTSPLAAFPQPDGTWAIVASNGGRDDHPAWYFNLQTHPETTVELPTGAGATTTRPVKARITKDAERDAIFAVVKTTIPGFADYEKATEREIPVVVLEWVEA